MYQLSQEQCDHLAQLHNNLGMLLENLAPIAQQQKTFDEEQVKIAIINGGVVSAEWVNYLSQVDAVTGRTALEPLYPGLWNEVTQRLLQPVPVAPVAQQAPVEQAPAAAPVEQAPAAAPEEQAPAAQQVPAGTEAVSEGEFDELENELAALEGM